MRGEGGGWEGGGEGGWGVVAARFNAYDGCVFCLFVSLFMCAFVLFCLLLCFSFFDFAHNRGFVPCDV